MFEKFDQSGRSPRQAQKEALNFIQKNWKEYDVLGINAPCGTGKSAIARAIMEEFPDAVYMTPNNMLVRQMKTFYPDLNVLIGKKHYNCVKNPALNCEDAGNSPLHKPCKECPYVIAKNNYLINNQMTVFNPISYWYCQKDPKWKKPKVIIVDEADKLVDMLMLVSGESFGKKYNPPRHLNGLIEVADWLKEKAYTLTQVVLKAETERGFKVLEEISKIQRVLSIITEAPESFVHSFDDKGELVILPIKPPSEIIAKLLNADKLILMSATLYQSDIAKITDKPCAFLELESPIDEARRRIYVNSSIVPFNYKTEPEAIAIWIKEQLVKYPSRNTIVHVTYSDAKKIKKFIKGAYVHDPDTKNEVLEKFKQTGGIWLAAGVHEGIDLPDDICTLNLIPKLPRANIEDPIIKRKLAKHGGQKEYDIQVLKTIQQAAGRSTRHEEDYSTTVIGDKRFLQLIETYKKELPKTFLESIRKGS